MPDAPPPVDVSAKPPRRFRRIRIAVSVFFGVLAIVLCVWWWGAIHVNEGLNLFGLGANPRSLDAYLFMASLSLVVAGVPWHSYLPRHFSLRTMLIATTLVAVMLGLVCYIVR